MQGRLRPARVGPVDSPVNYEKPGSIGMMRTAGTSRIRRRQSSLPLPLLGRPAAVCSRLAQVDRAVLGLTRRKPGKRGCGPGHRSARAVSCGESNRRVTSRIAQGVWALTRALMLRRVTRPWPPSGVPRRGSIYRGRVPRISGAAFRSRGGSVPHGGGGSVAVVMVVCTSNRVVKSKIRMLAVVFLSAFWLARMFSL